MVLLMVSHGYNHIFHGITQWFNLGNKKIEIAVGCMCWIMGRKWKFVPVVEELFLNKDGTEKL